LLAADWPHWRGPERNDVVDEPSGWDGEQWKLPFQWEINVGEGSSSPIVVGEQVYVMGSGGDQEHLICLDRATGTEVWRQSYPAPLYGRQATGDQGIYSGISSTPEFDAETGFIYSLGIDGELACWNTAQNGENVWRRNLYDDYQVGQRPDVGGLRGGASQRDYGYTTSPLVANDQLIVEVGDTATGSVKGFDKQTGAELWTSELHDEAGHSGGLVPIDVEGIPCVVVLTMRSLAVMRIDGDHAGKTVGQTDWTTDFANAIPTPAVEGNLIVVTTAYNQYAMACFEATAGGLVERWRKDNPSGVCSPVIYNGHIYWSWQEVHCVRLDDGEQLWQGGGTGYPGSCIATSDGRIISLADSGKLLLVESADNSSSAYTELARLENRFPTDAWPHVVMSDGQLLIKDRLGNVQCYGVGMDGE
jgi:outer membrane protein assembly factor BamB